MPVSDADVVSDVEATMSNEDTIVRSIKISFRHRRCMCYVEATASNCNTEVTMSDIKATFF